METLTAYRKNIYSQNGEDGIIEEICLRMGIKTGSFVEFGAWDGKHLSNTYNLLNQGWRGVYIEGDDDKFQDLLQTAKNFSERVQAIHASVEIKGMNSLDNLLSDSGLDENFELLSIDVDSYDWHIWRSLQNYHPKIVIIEINSSIPIGIYQTHRDDKIQGSSFSATVDLGREKGYVPVCHTGNLFFVKKDEVAKLMLPEEYLKYPELLFDYNWISLQHERSFHIVSNKIIRIYYKLKKMMNL